MQTADVSVVIPYFNAPDKLSRALESVLAQTVRVREIIVVDDASSVQAHLDAKRQVQLTPGASLIVLESNRGPGMARNAGWDVAVGEWVAFLDSDDAWHPKKIELQLQAAGRLRVEPAIVACRWLKVADLEQLSRLVVPDPPCATSLTKCDFVRRNQISTPTVMLRRNLTARFPDERYAEDYELWLLIAGSGEQVLRLEAPLVGLFKAPFGESGLSASIWKMIGGEFRSYLGAYRGRALSPRDLLTGWSIAVVRTTTRLVRIGLRRMRRLK